LDEYKSVTDHGPITAGTVLDLDTLQQIPCITNVPQQTRPLWEICLPHVWMPLSLAEWKSSMDSLRAPSISQTLFMNLPEDERRELGQIYGFPTIELPGVPPISMINQVLVEGFENLFSGRSALLRQTEISGEITRRVTDWLPDIVILIIFDGLSFHDVAGWEFPESWRVECNPCFVNGLSDTQSGMLRLIGSPCLAHRLFGLGYKQRLGFSYWERSQNRLTDRLFSEFPATQLLRVTTLEEVLHKLRNSDLTGKTFIQIVRTGLDAHCHYHRESPDRHHLLDALKNSIERVVESLYPCGKRLKIFVTSDHGILWFDKQRVAPFIPESNHPRYINRKSKSSAKTLSIHDNSEIYTVLVGDDVIARNRRVTEWGFHGGVSAQESMVPLLDISPNS